MLFMACGPTYKDIRIDTQNVRPAMVSAAEGKVLNVNILVDRRSSVRKNALVLSGDKEKKDGGKRVCVNAESGYRRGMVPRQVSSALVDHLRRRRSFGTVLLGRHDGADFQLSGDLVMLYGRQEYDISLAVWSGVGAGLGGVAGAAIMASSANGVSPTTVEIVLANLVIHDRYGNRIATIDDVHVVRKAEMTSDQHCWAIYEDVNEKLAQVIAGLAQVIEAAVSGNTSVSGWKVGKAVVSPWSTNGNQGVYSRPVKLKSKTPTGSSGEGTQPANTPCIDVDGECLSPCNPPCQDGEVCLRSGMCVPGS